MTAKAAISLRAGRQNASVSKQTALAFALLAPIDGKAAEQRRSGRQDH
jgi:hypothetical protein